MCLHCITIGFIVSIPFLPIVTRERHAFVTRLLRGLRVLTVAPAKGFMEWALNLKPLFRDEQAAATAMVPLLFGAAIYFNFSP